MTSASLAPWAATERPVAGAAPRAGEVIVDRTHCGRRVTGLERITLELFSDEALAPLSVTGVAAANRREMMLKQTFALPWLAARRPGALVLCPGFPPTPALSLFGARVLPYIHDLFLITRPQDLNVRARLYMAPSFRFAVKRLPRFLVNSEYTRDELRRFCRPDAEIQLYRPQVRNVFALTDATRSTRPGAHEGPRLVALGTVEPRKNLIAAARIVAALRAQGCAGARLDIVGRAGWGEDATRLAAMEGVTLHGYQPVETVRALVDAADALISTSHDEGLGLPLIEAQYAGLQVIAPRQRIFQEALGESGLFVDPEDAHGAARAILAGLSAPDWRARSAAAARANLERWNGQAERDRGAVLDMIARLSARRSAASC